MSIAAILAAKTKIPFLEFAGTIRYNKICSIRGSAELLAELSQKSIQEHDPKWQFREANPADDAMPLYKAEADYLLAAYVTYIDPNYAPRREPLAYDEAKAALQQQWIRDGAQPYITHEMMGYLQSAIEKLARGEQAGISASPSR